MEMDAAMAWHIPWDAWLTKNPIIRAEMTAFHIFKSKYESYLLQHRTKPNKRNSRGQKAYEQMDLELK